MSKGEKNYEKSIQQVGGLHPGITLGTSAANHRVKVEVEQANKSKVKPATKFINLQFKVESPNSSNPDKHSKFLGDVESRLLLLYTGKPRLAKNLLQNVVSR